MTNTNTKITGIEAVKAAPTGTFSPDNLAKFQEYDSQLSIPEISGSRIVRCIYRSKGGNDTRPSAYIRIPTEHISEEIIISRISELAPFVVSYLQSKEDEIIKEAHKAGQKNYYFGALSLDKIIELLEESEVSARFNKEQLESWFSEVIEAELASLFAEKFGISVESASDSELMKLRKVLDAYKAKFAGLASPKVSYKEDDCKAMIKVIREADKNDSLIGKRLISKLENMNKKVEETLELL